MHGSIWWLVLSAAISVIGFGAIGLAFARVDRPERRGTTHMKGNGGSL